MIIIANEEQLNKWNKKYKKDNEFQLATKPRIIHCRYSHLFLYGFEKVFICFRDTLPATELCI